MFVAWRMPLTHQACSNLLDSSRRVLLSVSVCTGMLLCLYEALDVEFIPVVTASIRNKL